MKLFIVEFLLLCSALFCALHDIKKDWFYRHAFNNCWQLMVALNVNYIYYLIAFIHTFYRDNQTTKILDWSQNASFWVVLFNFIIIKTFFNLVYENAKSLFSPPKI